MSSVPLFSALDERMNVKTIAEISGIVEMVPFTFSGGREYLSFGLEGGSSPPFLGALGHFGAQW